MINLVILRGTTKAYYKGGFVGYAVAKTKDESMCLVRLKKKDYDFDGWLGKNRSDIPKRFQTEDRYYFFCMDGTYFKTEKISAYGVE